VRPGVRGTWSTGLRRLRERGGGGSEAWGAGDLVYGDREACGSRPLVVRGRADRLDRIGRRDPMAWEGRARGSLTWLRATGGLMGQAGLFDGPVSSRAVLEFFIFLF
jgi:hypothetical protein